MKSLIKRWVAIFLVATMCLVTGATAFAAEPETTESATCYNLEVSSDGIVSCTDENGNEVSTISPRSSISGYGSDTLSSSNPAIVIYPDASGIGGMGITIKTSSSWNGYMKLIAVAQYSSSSYATLIDDYAISSNTEVYFNDLLHRSPGYIMFAFDGIPSGKTVSAQIWVYG